METNGETVSFEEKLPDDILFQHLLSTVNQSLLTELQKHYSLKVKRGNVSRGNESLRGKVLSDHNMSVDQAEGICITAGSKSATEILVRSDVVDGNVIIDFGVLLHEIGHAFDNRIADFQHGGKALPFHKSNKSDLDMEKAFLDEHKVFHQSYFHTQPEFFAEVFSMYSLDRARTFKRFPQTVGVLDSIMKKLRILDDPIQESIVDAKLLATVYEEMMPPPPVTSDPDVWEIVKSKEVANQSFADYNRNRSVYAVCLITEDSTASRVIARDICRRIFTHRVHNTSTYSVNDAFREVDMKSSTLDDEIFKHHYANHALVLLAKAEGVHLSSPGLQSFLRFAERTQDLCLPIFYGNRSEIERLKGLATKPTVTWLISKVREFAPAQVLTQVIRQSRADGKFISAEAEVLFLKRIADLHLGFDEVDRIQSEIVKFQNLRTEPLINEKKITKKGYFNILTLDIESAMKQFKKGQETNPLEDLSNMIGLTEVKDKVKQLYFELEEIVDQGGGALPKLYFLFLGNPGTGKTVVAKIVARIMQKLGVVKNKKYIEVGAMDIKDENDMKRIFQENRDGVIFIDEFHQLASSEDRKKALKQMVPYLTSTDYEDTVVIGAGYKRETLAMIRDKDIDPGLDSRFQTRFEFKDYTREELGAILRKKCSETKPNQLTMTEDVFNAALDEILRRQRAMMNPSNGRTVEKVLESAVSKLRSRVAQLRQNNISIDKATLDTLRREFSLGEFCDEQRFSIKDFWALFDRKYSHLADLRKLFEGIWAKEERNKKQGQATNSIYNFVFQGSPGTGKSTIARELIGPFFCALDILPYPDIVDRKGSQLQGRYVGHTGPLIEAMFRDAWGRTLFIDEISAIAGNGALYGNEAVKAMLPFLEDPELRGRFVVVIADYDYNIRKFFALDGGLSSRFPRIINIPNWDVPTCVTKLISAVKIKDPLIGLESHQALLYDLMPDLVAEEKFANGRTICDGLADSIYEINACSASDDIPDAIRKAFTQQMKSLFDQRSKDFPESKNPINISGLNLDTEVQSEKVLDKQVDARSKAKLFKAIEEVDQMTQFKDRYNRNPELLDKDIADVNSDYNKELAKKLNTSADKARKMRILVARKVKEKVMVKREELVRHFQYHCPFCGNVDSPTCAYINYPLEWKIERSLKKPWTETVTREIETLVEKEVMREIDV